MSKFVCNHPWTHFEVNNPNGNVTMCCDNGTVLGNLADGSIEDIWNGEGFQKMRREMRDRGALALCPHTCPVIHGGKTYQRMDWLSEMEAGGVAKANAELNEREFEAGKLVLDSLPRWMRFAYSFACNLDCYHCFQREDATQNQKLPDSFLEEVKQMAKVFQVIFPFGGEPFLFKPVLDFVENAEIDQGCRYFFVTNATLLTDRIFDILSNHRLGLIAVSLDAADAQAFDVLRKRGRKADWDEVMGNLKRLKELKRQQDFVFTIGMTVNSVNYDQIEQFVDLGLSVDAEPMIGLVANPYQTYDFQKDFLHFTDEQFLVMSRQIERSLSKVRQRGFHEAESFLLRLAGCLKEHQSAGNSLRHFAVAKTARSAFRLLPEMMQQPLRDVVQFARKRRLDKFLKS